MKDDLTLTMSQVDAGDMYSGYSYSPSSVGFGDYLSDFLLGTNNVQNKNQNKLNWEMMKEQNRFNEYMSNTSYQRAVRDMKKAGINPMVASLSGGSSAPSSASVSQIANEGTAKAINRTYKEIISTAFEVAGKIASILV